MLTRILGLCLVLSLPLVGVSQAHLPVETGKCFKVAKAKKVGQPMVTENGFYLEQYDTNGDGQPDLVTLSHLHVDHLNKDGVPVYRHDPHPVFYLVREGHQVYIDKVGRGACKDIVLYYDGSIPHDMGLNFNEPSPLERGREI